MELYDHSPIGRLLVFDPITQKTTTLLSGLYFANGVALSSDESFVLVNETLMYRIQKYWLKGDKAGTSEIFIENIGSFLVSGGLSQETGSTEIGQAKR